MILTKISWVGLDAHYEWLVDGLWVPFHPLHDKHVPISAHVSWFTVELHLTDMRFMSHYRREEEMGWNK